MKSFLSILFIVVCALAFGQNPINQQTPIDSTEVPRTTSDKVQIADFEIIENVPVYKGCEREKGNINKKKCMSQKIGQLFAKEFSTTIPENSDMEPGLVRVFVTFKVDTDGKVTQISARGPERFLEIEAKRVAQLIPKLKPGIQRGEPVIVPYSLPLQINLDRKINKAIRYPVYRGCDKDLSNEELEDCSKKKIADFIKVSFDYEMANRVFLTEESTSFQLDFTITKKGKISNVNAKANHRAIAIEAIRLAKRLPKFKAPGTRNGKPVDVPFSLLMTIYFQ